MLSITVICVGKIKESYFTQAIKEYEKRLSRSCRLSLIEVRDEATPERPTQREKAIVLEKEGERILKQIPDGSFLIPLCVEGSQKTSEALAAELERLMVTGTSHIAFVIGGSFGLSNAVKRRGNLCLSFSKMTFPHQLMRVVLMEQIYRAFSIIEGRTYHK